MLLFLLQDRFSHFIATHVGQQRNSDFLLNLKPLPPLWRIFLVADSNKLIEIFRYKRQKYL
jgi:hypothetical protein